MSTSYPFKERYIAINGSGGAIVTINSTIFCRKVAIVEVPDPATFDGSTFLPQGLVYQYGFDGFVGNHDLTPAEELDIENDVAIGNNAGSNVGSPVWTDPAGNSAGGTPLIKARSATATATTVRVREYP